MSSVMVVSAVPCQRLLQTSLLSSKVCASCNSTVIETLLEHEQRVCSSTVVRVITSHRAKTANSRLWHLRQGASRQEVEGCCFEHRSFVGEHKLACKTIVLRTYRMQSSECVHAKQLPLWCPQFVKGFLLPTACSICTILVSIRESARCGCQSELPEQNNRCLER